MNYIHVHKFFPLLLAFCLLVALLPVTARAETETQSLVFSISEGNFRFAGTSGQNGPVYTGQPDAWSWDQEANILKLDGFEWVTTSGRALEIVGSDRLTIDIAGDNRFESTTTHPAGGSGIDADLHLILSGDGVLHVVGGSSVGGRGLSTGLHSITISGPTIHAWGGIFGVVCRGLSITGGALYTVSNQYGVYANNYDNTLPHDVAEPFVTITGGTLTAQANNRAIVAQSVVTIAPAYTWWASDETTGPGGEGTTYPPTSYVYSLAHKFVKIDATGKASNPTLTGTIASYNPNTPATARLMLDGEIKHETDTETKSGAGQTEQSFKFENVASGTYTLVITKPGHTSYTVREITIGTEDIDLGTMTLRCGDINGDNMINDADLAILWLSANYNKSTAQAANKLCDLNGDGMINDADLAILWLAANYNKGAVVVG